MSMVWKESVDMSEITVSILSIVIVLFLLAYILYPIGLGLKDINNTLIEIKQVLGKDDEG